MPKPPSQPGCSWVEECIEECDAPSLFVEDRGVRATFLNPRGRRLRKVHDDGCYGPRDTRQADFIVGLIGVVDVVVELKQSDTNIKGAADQVEETLDAWRQDGKRAPSVAALIVYGRIEGTKKLPGRLPRAKAVISGIVARFVKRGTLIVIAENGARQYSFTDFIG
jgi:hypothetical protein